jgi:hypothetical protein
MIMSRATDQGGAVTTHTSITRSCPLQQEDDRRRIATRQFWRRALLIGTPAAWIVVALLHPVPDNESVFEDLSGASGRWLGVHLAQLCLTVLMGAVLWTAVRGRSGLAPSLTRCAVPIYLVFFAAFDAVAGIASGLAVRHGNGLTGEAQQGAASTAEHLLLNHVAGDASPLAAISTVSLTTAVIGVSMTWRRAGAARWIWIPVIGGVLLNFHAAGAIPVLGLGAFASAMFAADRNGLVKDHHDDSIERGRRLRSGTERGTTRRRSRQHRVSQGRLRAS